MGSIDQFPPRLTVSHRGSVQFGPKLAKLGLSDLERRILNGWGMNDPYIGNIGQNQDEERVYYWHGSYWGTTEVPVIAVKPYLQALNANLRWCTGVVSVDKGRLPTQQQLIDAAEFPANSDGSTNSLLRIAIHQLSEWVRPYVIAAVTKPTGGQPPEHLALQTQDR